MLALRLLGGGDLLPRVAEQGLCCVQKILRRMDQDHSETLEIEAAASRPVAGRCAELEDSD